MSKTNAAAACAILLLSACGASEEESTAKSIEEADREVIAQDTAGAAPAEQPAPAATADAAPAATPQAPSDQEALLRRGKVVFLRCRSCHTLAKDQPHLVGPNLHGLFGATAGTIEGYNFSDALVSSEITWSVETLDPWIENPNTYVPGNRMVFAGLQNEQDRAALIAYLMQETK